MSQVRCQFNSNDPKYMCCCGCHIMTGAKILASIFTIVIVLQEVYVIAVPRDIGVTNDEKIIAQIILYSHLVAIPINALILGTLWFGLIKERHRFLIPTLFCLVLSLAAVMMIGARLIAMTFVLTNKIGYAEAGIGALLLYTFVFGGVFALQCWFFHILKNAYSYIKQKQLFLTSDDFIVQQMEQARVAEPTANPAPPAYNEAAAYHNFSGKNGDVE
uniref:DUF7027 domain-containing protein n=1 Tax=Plectus sambesii TaxID=2011161 RepID=A0A914XAY5_9BILA